MEVLDQYEKRKLTPLQDAGSIVHVFDTDPSQVSRVGDTPYLGPE